MKINGNKTNIGVIGISIITALVASGLVAMDNMYVQYATIACALLAIIGLIHKGQKFADTIKQFAAVFMYASNVVHGPSGTYMTQEEFMKELMTGKAFVEHPNGTKEFVDNPLGMAGKQTIGVPDILKPNNALGENKPEPIDARPLPTPPPPAGSEEYDAGDSYK